MSISAISSGRTQLDQSDDRDPQSLQKPTQAREFDFAGKVYAAVTLPHGLISGLKLAAIVGSLLALKEKAAAGVIGIEIAEKALNAGDKTFGLVDDVKTFVRQLKEEQAAAKAAHPDVVRLENDLVEMVESGAKLAVDLRKLGGT